MESDRDTNWMKITNKIVDGNCPRKMRNKKNEKILFHLNQTMENGKSLSIFHFSLLISLQSNTQDILLFQMHAL